MRIQENVQIRVSLVLQFIDDFTNQPVDGPNLRVKALGAPGPVRKKDGYYVFTGLSGDSAQVTAEGPWYDRQSFFVSLRREEAPVEVRKVRLFPNASCPISSSATCAYGRALPGELLAAYCPGGGEYKRLLYDVKKGAEEIALYCREEEDLEGCLFCLLDREADEGEFLELGGRMERARGIYRLKAPLSGSYKKIGTKLVPVRRTRAGQDGQYFLPLSVRESGDRDYVFWRRSDGRAARSRLTKIELAEGVRSRLDWEAEA